MKTTNRRSFIKGIAAATAAGLIIPETLFAMPTKKTIGIQLYTIREMVNKDFEGTLKILSDIGYNSVEAAGYGDRKFYGYEPQEYSKICSDHGILPLSSHSGINLENADVVIEDTAEAGMSYLVLPSIPKEKRQTLDDYKRLADEFNKIGEKCKKAGLKFGYHNHAFEFSQKLNNEMVFDIIMRKIDPKLVALQLDIGNLYNGGAIAADVIKKYPNRFETIHVKDEIPATEGDEKYVSCILGKGIVNSKEVIDMATKSGSVKSYIIEQESYQGMSAMDSVKEDLAIMRKWGY